MMFSLHPHHCSIVCLPWSQDLGSLGPKDLRMPIWCPSPSPDVQRSSRLNWKIQLFSSRPTLITKQVVVCMPMVYFVEMYSKIRRLHRKICIFDSLKTNWTIWLHWALIPAWSPISQSWVEAAIFRWGMHFSVSSTPGQELLRPHIPLPHTHCFTHLPKLPGFYRQLGYIPSFVSNYAPQRVVLWELHDSIADASMSMI